VFFCGSLDSHAALHLDVLMLKWPLYLHIERQFMILSAEKELLHQELAA